LNGNSKIYWFLALGVAGYAAWAYIQAQSSSANSGASGDTSGSGDASLGGASGGAAASDSQGLAGIVAGAAATVGYTLGVYTPKGLRNHNPGNLRYVASIPWNGQTGDDGTGYAVFDTDENGVRALGHQLGTYASRGLNTVNAIISTYAPSNENNTAAYIAAVSSELGVDQNQSIDVNGVLPQLVAAIIHHENGVQPFALSDLQTWVYEA
jgi:hypothetical protein